MVDEMGPRARFFTFQFSWESLAASYQVRGDDSEGR
jgi:hypothetical protein